MNNILFFLTPKAMCAFLYDDYTVRQALEKMETAGYAALPILNRQGEYRGTLTEGDVLWAMKNMCSMDLYVAETKRIMDISRRKDNVPVGVDTPMMELVERAVAQSFVPVVDYQKGHRFLLRVPAVRRKRIIHKNHHLPDDGFSLRISILLL